jgi:hypothetical protein
MVDGIREEDMSVGEVPVFIKLREAFTICVFLAQNGSYLIMKNHVILDVCQVTIVKEVLKLLLKVLLRVVVKL